MVHKITVAINNQLTDELPKGLRLLVRRCCKAILETESFTGMAEISITFMRFHKAILL